MGEARSWTFELLADYFVDYKEVAKRHPHGLVLTQPKLGLIDRSYDNEKGTNGPLSHSGSLSQWLRFETYVRYLNDTSPEGTCYKLLYVLRHGTGVHNVVIEKLKSDKEKWDQQEKNWNVSTFYDKADAPTNGE